MQSMRLRCALRVFLLLAAVAVPLSGCRAYRVVKGVVSGKEEVPVAPDDSESMTGAPRRAEWPAFTGPQSRRVRPAPFPQIRFAGDGHELSRGEAAKVREIAVWLKGHPERVVIAGGAKTGALEYSRQLGEMRAAVVRDLLIDRGVPAGRIVTVSYGEDGPVSVDGVVFGLVSTGGEEAAAGE
jgi:outer membrane protein OmpA-like peptidoglycan-associated protein